MNVQLSSESRSINFGLILYLHPNFVCASSEDYKSDFWMLAYAISTKMSCAARILSHDRNHVAVVLHDTIDLFKQVTSHMPPVNDTLSHVQVT